MTELLKKLVDDYSTKKQPSLIQMKKGVLSREAFLNEAVQYAMLTISLAQEQAQELVGLFEQYIFGYSRISPSNRTFCLTKIPGYTFFISSFRNACLPGSFSPQPNDPTPQRNTLLIHLVSPHHYPRNHVDSSYNSNSLQ